MSFGINLGDIVHDAANFTGGLLNAWGSDEVLGAGRQDQDTTAGKLGAAFGDAAAVIQGLYETGAGLGGEVGGLALDATGVGAVAGVPVNIVSAGLIVHGAATSLTGVTHLAMSAAQSNPGGTGSTGGPGQASGSPNAPGTLTGNLDRLSPAERDTGERFAKQNNVHLKVSDHVGSEYVDDAGKTYDAMGTPDAYSHWHPNQFFKSIRDHLNKSNDYTIIDFKGASSDQVQQIKDYVSKLDPTQQAKIKYLGA